MSENNKITSHLITSKFYTTGVDGKEEAIANRVLGCFRIVIQ